MVKHFNKEDMLFYVITFVLICTTLLFSAIGFMLGFVGVVDVTPLENVLARIFGFIIGFLTLLLASSLILYLHREK